MKNLLLFAVVAAFGFAFSTGEKGTGEHNHVRFEGTYESKQGVMHHVSCHGSNIGYLTTGSGEKVVVCFDRLDGGNEIRVNCDNLMVEGYFEEVSVEADGGPCRAGILKVLFVEEWGCL